MLWRSLNKADTSVYKGMAILMIVVHNFMHRFPSPREMEFEFVQDGFSIFLESLLQPENLFQAIPSYLGHYGVQIFIFLSAYGLTKKYLHGNLAYWKFLRKRLVTIYPSFILAILLWAFVKAKFHYGVFGLFKYLYWNVESVFLKLTLVSNFIPSESFSLVGPWWFISLIFQFYFVYPFLLMYYEKWSNKGLIILSILSIFFVAF